MPGSRRKQPTGGGASISVFPPFPLERVQLLREQKVSESDPRRPAGLSAFLACMALSFVWGLQQVAIKAAGPDFSPLFQTGLRSGVAAALLIIANAFLLHEKWKQVSPKAFLAIALSFAGEFFFVSEGLRWTTASHMSVLLYTAPFFAAIGLSAKLPEERLTALQWAGLLAAFSGIAVAFLLPALLAGDNPESSLWLLGDALGLMAGVSWGLTTILLRTTSMNGAPATQMAFAQLLGGFAVLTPAALLTGQSHFAPTFVSCSSFLFQALIVCFASYLVWNRLLRIYPASQLGIFVLATPIFGVALSVLLLGDSLNALFFAGTLLVFAGLLMVQWRTIRAFLAGSRR